MLATDTAPELAESEEVLASSFFAGNTNSSRFLKYVCDRYFAGIRHVTESEIAVEALGRRPEFDPQQDSIVRVEAHRVRKRLRDYYEREGAAHPLQLVLPHGSYVPHFVPAQPGQIDDPIEAHTEGFRSHPLTETPLPALAPRRKARLPRYGWYLAAGCLLPFAAAAVFLFFSGHRITRPLKASVTPLPSPGLAAASPDVLIMAGSSANGYIDQLGHIWSADSYFNGGTPWAIRYRRIARTDDPQLFLSARQGQDFKYDIPLKPGFYELRLYFAETFYGSDNSEGGGESSRVFDVQANGQPLLVNFDPLSDAGGSNGADVRVFAGVTPAADGKLHLRFANRWMLKGVAFVNAIELIRTEGKVLAPVRLVANSSAVEDKQGQLWIPDQYVKGGRRRQLAEEVQGTPDPELYQSERYGNFSYEIPVAPNAAYRLTLHFSEHWFGVPGYGSAGAGQDERIFDVYCNGASLLHDFDIARETGGSLKALTKTFHGLVPNHQGKLLLSFVPNKDYATVTAIEVTQE